MSTVQTRDGRDVAILSLSVEYGPALQRFNAALSDASRALFLPHAYDDTTLAKIIARAEEGTDHAYIALVDTTVIGYFFLWDMADTVPVLGIGIADDWQGQGLGKAFMNYLIEDARTTGSSGIELTTTLENSRAFSLYQSVGFKHMGNTDNIAGDGRTVRERVMFLPLKPDATPPAREFGPPV